MKSFGINLVCPFLMLFSIVLSECFPISPCLETWAVYLDNIRDFYASASCPFNCYTMRLITQLAKVMAIIA